MTLYDRAEQVPLPGEDVLDLLGSAGGSTIDQGYIRRQGVFNLGYQLRNLSTNWHMRYVGRADMSPESAEAGFPEIGSQAVPSPAPPFFRAFRVASALHA